MDSENKLVHLWNSLAVMPQRIARINKSINQPLNK
jgi:hypothetical protein